MSDRKWDRQGYEQTRALAEFVGITASHTWWRYTSVVGGLLCLTAAAALLGPAQLAATLLVLLIGFGVIFLIVRFWFVDEDRKRRVMFGELKPRHDDGKNADLRDEVIVACAALFFLTPLLLQTLNSSTLHLSITPDFFGLSKLDNTGFAENHPRLLELPSWILFTILAFLNTIPVIGYALPSSDAVTGIGITPQTPSVLRPTLELLFAVFLGSIVYGQFGRISTRVNEAIGALKATPVIATAIGPIAVKPLQEKIIQADDRETLRNALIALADIATKYPDVVSESRLQIGPRILEIFETIPLAKALPQDQLELLTALVYTSCRLDIQAAIRVASARMVATAERYATKRELADEIARDPNFTRAIDILEGALATSPGGNIEKRIRNHLHYLRQKIETVNETPVTSNTPTSSSSLLDAA